MSPWDVCLPIVLAFEGGYINDPKDRGGATNFGITIATLAAWRHRPTSIDDVVNLTRAEAASIYKADYWDRISGDQLPVAVGLVVFDSAVNSSPSRAGHWLQAACGASQDGEIGPETLAHVRATTAASGAAKIAEEVLSQRLVFLTGLDSWKDYKNGWSRRLMRLAFLSAAL